VWCHDNNLSLNVSKTKEARKRRAEHTPIHINWAVVERVDGFMFPGVYITKNLSWSKHTNTYSPAGD
jgi:hypothetical protein